MSSSIIHTSCSLNQVSTAIVKLSLVRQLHTKKMTSWSASIEYGGPLSLLHRIAMQFKAIWYTVGVFTVLLDHN